MLSFGNGEDGEDNAVRRMGEKMEGPEKSLEHEDGVFSAL